MQGQGSEIQTDDAESLPGVKKDDAEMVQVRAFPEASSVQVLSSNTEATTVFPVLNARVVNKEEPALPVPILEAKSMEEDSCTNRKNGAPESSAPESKMSNHFVSGYHVRCRCDCRSCATHPKWFEGKLHSSTTTNPRPCFSERRIHLPQSQQEAQRRTMSSSTFLAELKPLLSNESLTALNNPDSPQSQSLQWLLEKSNFQDWSFQRQVQRFAMATIYYATGGPSWSNAGGNNWLTNATECGWFQGGSHGDVCNDKDALVSLEQYGNELKGTIPDEIGLLTSLTSLDLTSNSISGTVPSQLGSLTALNELYLNYNSFNSVATSPG